MATAWKYDPTKYMENLKKAGASIKEPAPAKPSPSGVFGGTSSVAGGIGGTVKTSAAGGATFGEASRGTTPTPGVGAGLAGVNKVVNGVTGGTTTSGTGGAGGITRKGPLPGILSIVDKAVNKLTGGNTSTTGGRLAIEHSGVQTDQPASGGSSNSVTPKPGSVESHRAYIEKTNPGGMAAYEKIQRDRYKQALADNDVDLINRLNADAARVGYSLQEPTIADKSTDNPETTTPAPDDYSWITDMVNNELASQKTAIEQELARLKQENELAVNQNNTFLQEQIKQLEENRVQVGNEIINFQNRRGGYWSGGVDYQTAHNNEAFAETQGDFTRDIAARNADIWNRNTLLAQQAYEKLAQLQTQAPDRIRQLIEEAKTKGAAAALEADKFALEKEKFGWEKTMDTADWGIRDRAQTLDETQVTAALTGKLPNGQPTTAEQQRQLENLWKAADQTGVIPNQLADIYGIPRGTQTRAAKEWALGYALDQERNSISWDSNDARWSELDAKLNEPAKTPDYSGMTAGQVSTTLKGQFLDQYGDLKPDVTKEQIYRSVVEFGLPDGEDDQVMLSLGLNKADISGFDKKFGVTAGK